MSTGQIERNPKNNLLGVIGRDVRGSWHRYERSKHTTNGAPILATSNKKTLFLRDDFW